MNRTRFGFSALSFAALVVLASCGKSSSDRFGRSDKTGWEYNNSRLGGFDVARFNNQITAPGLAFVEGGRFTMGQTEEDLTAERNNIPVTVTVSSFYMDETEVANVHYREYVYWLQRAYGQDYPDVVARAMPDTLAWREAMSYNEPLVQYYFRHAAYNQYPVVGVTWNQANQYAKWRSDRVNELILIKVGALKENPNQTGEDVFTTETYQYGQYEGEVGRRRRKDFDPNSSGARNWTYEDGLLLPNYRLPTEAEWEYAAYGNINNNPEPRTARRRGEEVITDRNAYPWGDPTTTRSGVRNEQQGEFYGNFQRQGGDFMGIAGGLNDNADITAPVYSYKPNGFGLYNMAGNVNEWVLDTYRPTTYADVKRHRPFRGNVYDTYRRLAEDGSLEEKDSTGNLTKRLIDTSEMYGRNRFESRNADLRDFEDGDSATLYSYDYGRTTLVNNDAKVIKGGSWTDRAYWLSPGTRRFMQANQTSNTVGFRCVMDRLGAPNGTAQGAGNYFSDSRRSRR